MYANVEGRAAWRMPKSFSDRGFLPWLGERMCEACRYAAEFLDEEEGLEALMAALVVDGKNVVVEWRERLRTRRWAVKPGNMKGSVATRALDIVLSASTEKTDRWDAVLVIGEHKSQVTLVEKRKTIAQLGGYAGELFGVQAFRHFIPGLTIAQDQLQLWICDRMGCFGSK